MRLASSSTWSPRHRRKAGGTPRRPPTSPGLLATVHGLADLALHGSLAATVGPDAADRPAPVPATTLALGLDAPVDHLIGPTADDLHPSLPPGATP